MKKPYARLLILSLAMLPGALPACNTDMHFMSTPYLDKDFEIAPLEMSRVFYDIDRYKEVTNPFFAYFEMPPIEELKYGCYFGAPVDREWCWWNFCPFFCFPIPFYPCKTLIWERGNYRFKAVVTYPMFLGYLPHLWYWEVEPIWSDYPYRELTHHED